MHQLSPAVSRGGKGWKGGKIDQGWNGVERGKGWKGVERGGKAKMALQ